MNRRYALALLASCVALDCGAQQFASLPDLKRGQVSAAAGDVAGAEADLVPLAEMGYTQAQVSLAALYAQSQDPDTVRKAVAWYKIAQEQNPQVDVPLARALLKLGEPDTFKDAQKFLFEADKKGDPRALAALVDFYTDHPEEDRDARMPKLITRAENSGRVEVEPALLRWYRMNPQVPRNVEQLAQRCNKAMDRVPECYVDLARYERSRHQVKPLKELMARATKRYESGSLAAVIVERSAWSLCSDTLAGEPQPDIAYPALKKIMNTSVTAQVRLARLQVEYPHLDPQANPEQVLLAAVAQGSDEAALALGRLYLTGTRIVADPEKAQKYLEQAASSQPAANYFLGRMYKRGENGTADPLKAAQYLLTAARGGYVRADYLLAQVFSDNRGARPNRVNALMFATLSGKNGIAEGSALANELRAQMPPADQQRADRLLAEETAARAPAPAPTQQRQALSVNGAVP